MNDVETRGTRSLADWRSHADFLGMRPKSAGFSRESPVAVRTHGVRPFKAYCMSPPWKTGAAGNIIRDD